MRTAVYAGSFDPLTNGHLWMIKQGLEMFDRPSCERLTISEFDNRYLVDYARSVDAQYILRGIRSPNDYEYERVMRHINGDMAPKITTAFLMPPRDIAELSSSMVKSLIGPEEWKETVRRYVPQPVFKALEKMDSA